MGVGLREHTFDIRSVASRSHRLAVAFGLLAAGCIPPTLPPPTVRSVEPERVWNGADIPVVITGSNFLPRIDVDAGGYGTDLDERWQVELIDGPGDGSLAGVSVQDAEHLLGVVPAGITAGTYGLRLTGPSGEQVESDDALLEVSDDEEVGLEVSYFDDPTAYTAGDRVRFLFEAVGYDSERVVTDVPVQVTLEGATVELIHTVEFEAVSDLPLNEGVGFVGVLPDGQAILPVELLAPGRVDVTIRSAPGAPELQQGTLTLFVDDGSQLPATIELPEDDFVAQAGVPFDITITVFELDGVTPVEDPVSVTVVNSTDCGGVRQEATVTGPTEVSVTATSVTDSGKCQIDHLTLADGGTGTSAEFEVVGGPATSFEVLPTPSVAPAGETITLFIRPNDELGNPTTWQGEVTVTDSIGSLDPATCYYTPEVIACFVVGTLAGDDIDVTVEGGGIEGTATGLEVLPGIDTGELIVTAPTDARAGDPVEVRVQPIDVYGNPQDAEVVGADAVVLEDSLGDASCAPTEVDAATGEQLFDCTFTVARDDAVLTATGLDASGSSDAFAVDNGSLGLVTVSAPAAVEAGDGFGLEVEAFDAYGNPYVRQDDPVVELADDLEGLTVPSVTLDASGQATTTAALTRAGTTTIRASQGGAELGASSPVEVSAGPTSGLSVTVDAPWAYVDQPVPLTVQSVDDWGNRTSLSGDVTISSRETSSPDLDLALVNGLAAGDYTWDEQSLDEVLDAITDGGVEGSSVQLYVVRTCPTGPTAALDFGGFDEALACFDETLGTATISASMAGTVVGTSPLFGYAIAAEGQPAVIDSQADLELTLDEVGSTVVRGLAVAANGCADETEGAAYVGLDDGSVTGPVTLSTAAVDIGPFDVATVDVVDALDCARDLASDATLRVRATGGTLEGGPVSSGEGLELTLDAFGSGSFDVVTAGELSEGDLDVHAWVDDGSAGGLLTVPFVGDEIRPTVRSQDPTGTTLELVDEVVLTFSEPLLPSSVLPSRFTLHGPGPAVVDSVLLSPDGTEVTAVFDVAADGAAGPWTLTVSREVRDVAGQRLAGQWGELAVDYVGSFGDVGGGVDPVTCGEVSPVGGRFAPDGDDGDANEADEVTVTVSSAFAPAWWVATVTDDEGTVVYQDWEAPLAPVDSWSWHGRDQRGFVVPNGTYQVALAPEDGVGNRGTACVVQAVVDNGRGDLPLGEAP